MGHWLSAGGAWFQGKEVSKMRKIVVPPVENCSNCEKYKGPKCVEALLGRTPKSEGVCHGWKKIKRKK